MRIDANVRRRTNCRQSSPGQATLDANSINSSRSAINPVINVLAVRCSLRQDVAADVGIELGFCRRACRRNLNVWKWNAILK